MIYREADLLPISGLQHLAFCERQCALIHLEQQWSENRFTAEGRVLHRRVHDDTVESRPGIRIARGLRLRSLSLGLAGIADVVEFHPSERDYQDEASLFARLPGSSRLWRPFPVEYKRGKPKPDQCDEVQLCAQAVCLEEMLNVHIPEGAIYYGKPRRRQVVALDQALRQETQRLAGRLHALIRENQTPAANYSARCRSCSLLHLCRPEATRNKSKAGRYIARALDEIHRLQEY